MTIVDIARESGYSVSTVSRVLNGRRDVSPAARQKIMEIVDAHKFVPNNNAKHLKQTVSKSLLILVRGTSNMLFANVIEALQATMENSNYSLRIHYLDEEANEVAEAIRVCREHKPKGIFFLGSNAQYFREQFEQVDVPCVLVTDRADELGFDNLSSVSTDDTTASEVAMDYLFDHGHRNIAIIGGDPKVSSPSAHRYEGCLSSYTKRGLTFEKKYYAKARYSFEGGYHAMKDLLDRKLPVTAVFAMGDVMAVGAMRAVFDAGLRVPQDISVVGFDGSKLADYYNPKIVTICQEYNKIAQRSVEILLQMIELNKSSVHELIPFALKNTQSVISLEKS